MIMRIWFPGALLIVAAMSFSSCGKDKEIKGKEFIKREVMVDVLVDIHLMDGVTNDRKFHRKYETDSIDLLSPILDKHQVSRVMFDTTMAEYLNYPELLDKVYNDVLIKLNVMLDENDKEYNVDQEQ